MSGFFKPYEGSRPFVFISYAHRQSDTVLDTIRIGRPTLPGICKTASA